MRSLEKNSNRPVRPSSSDANLANDVHIGNFVEVKNSNIGVGSKANHFTYLGDADIGAGVILQAGPSLIIMMAQINIVPVIEDNVFIMVPITHWLHQLKIAQGATTGAGSTLTRDVAEHSLAVERSKQFEKQIISAPKS